MAQLIDTDVTLKHAGAHLSHDIVGLTADSRLVRPGYLFAALPGVRDDGRRFVDDAIARGAVAVLGAPGLAPPPHVALLEATNPRRAFARLAARFYGRQPRVIAAVTGTNGKTSVADFTRQLWATLGERAASIGTLGLVTPDFSRPGALTTPDPVSLHKDLADLALAKVERVAMEASSHGLDQHRLDGVAVTAAAFLNLSHEHLDYHATMAAYFAAKRRLFSEVMAPGSVAVVNADAPEAPELATIARARGGRVIDFGRAAKSVRLLALAPVAHGQRLSFAVDGREHTVMLRLVGDFQAMNALAALSLVMASGSAPEPAVAALASLEAVPGRLQCAAVRANGGMVYVDYAHKPLALETVLRTLRPYTHGRLLVVFGCGGDRDAAKRPMMGAIATRLADQVFVTDDNPRSEEPAAIRRQILAAAPAAREIADRREAIFTAAAALDAGDLLVIAGKGHETGQIVGAKTLPFDDVEVARAAVVAADGGGA